ncbi:unnamed protein product [Victoria cruziana]
MNSRMLLNPEHPLFELEWALANITTTFFKCTRWQVEETTDPVSCPYHYFCDSTYQGNYPPAVDLSVLLLAAASYLMAASLAMVEVGRFIVGREPSQPVRRYWIPSGPMILPLILLCLAKGHRINTILPFYYAAPPVLQLIHVSALAFENPPAVSVKSVFLEVSTISGILHGSLYVDALILPYYTGLEALISSTFSGECTSCVCRKQILTIGGAYLPYRGWSATMISIACILCFRLVFGVYRNTGKAAVATMLMLEGLAWILSIKDNARLILNSTQGQLAERAVCGSICGLICLLLLKRFANLLASTKHFKETKSETGLPLTHLDYDKR